LNKIEKCTFIHIQPFKGINIKLDVAERGLKCAWLFQRETFSPWNLLLLTQAVCECCIIELNSAGGDVEIMLLSDLHLGSLPGLWTRYFHLNLNVKKKILKWQMTHFPPLDLRCPFDLPPEEKKGKEKGSRSPWGGWKQVSFSWMDVNGCWVQPERAQLPILYNHVRFWRCGCKNWWDGFSRLSLSQTVC